MAFENLIYIYSTWSLDHVATLRGHDGRVRSLCWSPNDRKLYSCGYDGKVVFWNALKEEIIHRFSIKDEKFVSLCNTDEKTDRVFAVSKSGTLWVSQLLLMQLHAKF